MLVTFPILKKITLQTHHFPKSIIQRPKLKSRRRSKKKKKGNVSNIPNLKKKSLPTYHFSKSIIQRPKSKSRRRPKEKKERAKKKIIINHNLSKVTIYVALFIPFLVIVARLHQLISFFEFRTKLTKNT